MAVNLKYKVISTLLDQQLGETQIRLEPNLKARRERHTRVFAKTNFFEKLGIFSFPKVQLGKLSSQKKPKNHQTPANRLFKSYSIAVGVLFIIGSVTPSNAFSYSSLYVPDMEAIDIGMSDSTLMTDQEGYIAKINPQTEFGDRSAMNGRLMHTVASGETISTIAQEYGLKTNTVLWENGLGTSSKIKVGQQLIIPPADGVSHLVQKGEDVKKIVGLYSVKQDALLKQNGLDTTAQLKEGQLLFIPGAKPLPVPEEATTAGSRNTPAKIASTSRVNKNNVGSTTKVDASAIGSNSDSKPAGDKPFIKPTRGKITQSFKSGHPAYDIANVDKPPIWAVSDGTIIKASSGTWGGGYGNHIIIDHGNGLQTLYAHLEYLSVSVGDKVSQGDVIGKMGRTGNVRGRTGIHLHFEVRVNGVKKSPANYVDF